MATTQVNNSNLYSNSYISEDWNGGYKLEVEFTSEVDVKDWSLNFELEQDYSIRGAYGVDLVDGGNGSYSLSGQGSWQDLNPGQTAKAIFIIDDSGRDAITPEFTGDDSNSDSEDSNSDPVAAGDSSLMGSTMSDPVSAPSDPAQLSNDAISVDFENHTNNTSYDYSAQSQDWDVAWSNQMDRFASISNQEARSGNNALQMTYPANEQSNAGAKWQVPSSQEYYLSYWVKFDGDFDFDGSKYSGGKLPGLGSGDLASGGTKPTGTNGFTSRYMWREGGKATLYLYHMDQPGTYGEDILLQDSNGNDKYFERGQWHNMIQRVKVNDGSQSNGEIDVWMDGEQVLDLDNLKFVTNGQGIDTTYFSSFHGGNGSEWWPDRDDNAYFDDFVVSTNAADVGL